jgi:hypothetical protein
MVLEGKRLYIAVCVGTVFSMPTYGWDAGVLGGILETTGFQSAMGVSLLPPNNTGKNFILTTDAYDHHHHNDSLYVSPRIMARLRADGPLLGCCKVEEPG